MKTITVALLKSKKACRVDLRQFIELFGDEAEVTEHNCTLAARKNLGLTWAVTRLLSPKARDLYQRRLDPVAYPRDEGVEAYREARGLAFYEAWRLDYGGVDSGYDGAIVRGRKEK